MKPTYGWRRDHPRAEGPVRDRRSVGERSLPALREAGGVGGGLGPATHAQLGEDVRHVVLDRLLGEEHLLTDLAVGETLGDVIEDLALLRGEHCELVVLAAVSQPLEHAGRDGGVEERLPPTDAPDPFDEIRPLDLLQQVAGGAREDRGGHRLVVGEGGQHHAGDVWALRADLPADLDAAPVGEAHVEHGDVGVRHRDPAVRLVRRAGLADDLEVVFLVDQLAQAPAHDLVIVQQEHPGGHQRILSDGAAADGPVSVSWMTATGVVAVARTFWLTDPSSRPLKPPMPRAPMTSSGVWAASAASTRPRAGRSHTGASSTSSAASGPSASSTIRDRKSRAEPSP